jgi:hypothetical protein
MRIQNNNTVIIENATVKKLIITVLDHKNIEVQSTAYDQEKNTLTVEIAVYGKEYDDCIQSG